jgi:uncharacterized glyoxalase superfamily protein PhnB
MATQAIVAEPQLFVTDMARALSYFRETLGFTLAFAHGTPPFYAQVTLGGARINLRHVDVPAFWPDFRALEADALSATLVCEDASALHARMAAAGATMHRPLRNESWGAKTFIVADPDGNLLCFSSAA